MSQQKVDYHKEQKRNRKQIMKKEKTMRRLEIGALIVVLAALVAWFSVQVYRSTSAKYAASHVETTEMNLSGWEKYTQNLGALMSGDMTAADLQDGAAEDAAAGEAEEPAAEEETVEETEEPAAEEEAAEETEEPAAEEEAAEETEEPAAEEEVTAESEEGSAADTEE